MLHWYFKTPWHDLLQTTMFEGMLWTVDSGELGVSCTPTA